MHKKHRKTENRKRDLYYKKHLGTSIKRRSKYPKKASIIHIKKIKFAPHMMIEVLKSKIHGARITQTELNYIGSITIDLALMEAANMIENEKVLVVNNNNGERFETYIITGERGSGVIGLNGAAARKGIAGDTLIIISFAHMDFEEAKKFKPTSIFPNKSNQIE
jgi:aspartate 1-decarboxylase